jgi:hypothetical protein
MVLKGPKMSPKTVKQDVTCKNQPIKYAKTAIYSPVLRFRNLFVDRLLAYVSKSLMRWESCRAIWLRGQPLVIGDHNLFILLALPELSEEKDVQLQHSAYDTDWKLPGGALQWDGPYRGWIAIHAE